MLNDVEYGDINKISKIYLKTLQKQVENNMKELLTKILVNMDANEMKREQ